MHLITGIPLSSQVLILCDLTDPDRNRDVVLTGRDHNTLFDCGIREDSFLTLHYLGAVRSVRGRSETVESQPQLPAVETFSLSTPITAADADHSYNGIIFDVESKSPYESEMISVSVAGMLGRVVMVLLPTFVL